MTGPEEAATTAPEGPGSCWFPTVTACSARPQVHVPRALTGAGSFNCRWHLPVSCCAPGGRAPEDSKKAVRGEAGGSGRRLSRTFPRNAAVTTLADATAHTSWVPDASPGAPVLRVHPQQSPGRAAVTAEKPPFSRGQPGGDLSDAHGDTPLVCPSRRTDRLLNLPEVTQRARDRSTLEPGADAPRSGARCPQWGRDRRRPRRLSLREAWPSTACHRPTGFGGSPQIRGARTMAF